jgi:transcriptional regulator with XRE-family HTH domain
MDRLSSPCDLECTSLSIRRYKQADGVYGDGKREEATLAGRIKLAMASAGISTTAQLAKKMNVNRQTVHRWISGEGDKLTPEMLFKLSDALAVNARWLALGSPNSPIKPTSPTVEQAEVLDVHRRLPAAAKDTWLSHGRDLIKILSPASAGNPFPVRSKK